MKNCIDIVSEYVENNNITTDFLDNLSETVVKLLVNTKLKISTAESLTGGMISKCITSVSGASEIFELGVCSSTYRIKIQELFVPKETIEEFSAVSEQTAVAMANGIIKKSSADIGIAVTGLAGPDGGTDNKPIGTVFVAVIYKEKCEVKNLKLYESFENLSREKIRCLTTAYALKMVVDII